MHLSRLRVQDFRCLGYAEIEPAPGINVVTGDNGSGKSSLLEALYFLGRGRSFRRTPAARLNRRGSDGLAVYGVVNGRGIGVTHGGNRTRIKIGPRGGASFYDLVTALPIQIIDPNLHRLLEEGPAVRRRYLDWGVFHVEHGFYPAWRRYSRALRQRNHALRSRQSIDVIQVWDAELARSALEVDALRQRYIHALKQVIPQMVERLLGEGTVTLDYHRGWPSGMEFTEALADALAKDRRGGFTHAGPHRADLRLRVGGLQARDWVSRGQQKVLSSALLLAQTAVLAEQQDIRPLLLVDDLAAELGHDYRSALFNVIESLNVQCFMTFLDAALVPKAVCPGAMFHVEHGRVIAPY